MTAGSDLRAAAAAARRFGPEWVRAGSRLCSQAIERQLRADTGGDGRLSGARELGAATVDTNVSGEQARISGAGAGAIWSWLENGTSAHEVRARGRMLATPYGPRARVRVRGMAAKHTWTQGNQKGLVEAERDALARFGRMTG